MRAGVLGGNVVQKSSWCRRSVCACDGVCVVSVTCTDVADVR